MAVIRKNFKKYIRLFLFYTFGRLGYKIGSKKDILILTSSRSGSTWLVESILKNGKSKLINQPFDCLFNSNVHEKRLPISNKNYHFINLTKEDEEKLFKFWHQLRDGRLNHNSIWKLFSKDFFFFYNRKIYKVFFMKDKIEFFINQNNLTIIYLLRNPMNTSLSNINYNYKPSGECFLRIKNIKDYPKEFKKLKEIYYETNSVLATYIISWCFENYKINNYSKNNDNIIILRYEDLVLNEKKMIEKLKKFINKDFMLKNDNSKTYKKQNNSLNQGLIHELKCEHNYDFINSVTKEYFNYNLEQ